MRSDDELRSVDDRRRERRRDAHRHILLGGGLLARGRDGDAEARRLIDSIRSGLRRASDLRAFDDWEVPGS